MRQTRVALCLNNGHAITGHCRGRIEGVGRKMRQTRVALSLSNGHAITGHCRGRIEGVGRKMNNSHAMAWHTIAYIFAYNLEQLNLNSVLLILAIASF
jgi:translation initiation factor IF-1